MGDPFKDTSGPSLNILLKLISVVALVMAPALVDKDKVKSVEMTEPAAIESVEGMEAPAEEVPAAEQAPASEQAVPAP